MFVSNCISAKAPHPIGGGAKSPHGFVVNLLDCLFLVSGFEFQSQYYVYFRANALRKYMNALPPHH